MRKFGWQGRIPWGTQTSKDYIGIDNPNSLFSTKEIEFIVWHLPTSKFQGLDSFTGELYKTF